MPLPGALDSTPSLLFRSRLLLRLRGFPASVCRSLQLLRCVPARVLRPPCSPTPSIPSQPTQSAIASGLHSIHSVNRASHPFIHSTSQLIQLIHIISYQTHPQLGYSCSPVPSRCCSRVSEALPRVRVASRIPHRRRTPPGACVRACVRAFPAGQHRRGTIQTQRGDRSGKDAGSEARDRLEVRN